MIPPLAYEPGSALQATLLADKFGASGEAVVHGFEESAFLKAHERHSVRVTVAVRMTDAAGTSTTSPAARVKVPAG